MQDGFDTLKRQFAFGRHLKSIFIPGPITDLSLGIAASVFYRFQSGKKGEGNRPRVVEKVIVGGGFVPGFKDLRRVGLCFIRGVSRMLSDVSTCGTDLRI